MSKRADCCWGRPNGTLFDSYYTVVLGRVQLFSLDFSTYSWFPPYNAVKQEGIKYRFWVFGFWDLDWNPISRTIGEHSNHNANGPVFYLVNLIFKHLFGTYMNHEQVLSFWVRVDLGVMEMKGYSLIERALKLELQNRMSHKQQSIQ